MKPQLSQSLPPLKLRLPDCTISLAWWSPPNRLAPYRFLIFYTIDDDIVVILNVRHPARRRPPTGQS
jgi:hypothetical protein